MKTACNAHLARLYGNRPQQEGVSTAPVASNVLRAKRPWQRSLVGGAPSDPLNSSRLGGELRNASPVMKVPVPVPGDAPYHVEHNLIYFWNHSI